LKGGHLRGTEAIDLLFTKEGAVREFVAPFVRGVETHGTGCTYSAAIATGLAKGLPLVEAVREGKEFVTRSISGFLKWRSARGEVHALHHFAGVGSSSQNC
jgi:hydroxymethylpyrimidine/phosphomethylpyrimidine kinase